MQKIISALIAALTFVSGKKEQVAALKEEVRQRDNIIKDLRTALDDENADDASLEAAAKAAQEAQAAAEQRYNDLLSSIEEANSKADELAQSLTDDPAIPIEVNPGTGEVTNTEEVQDTVSAGVDTLGGGEGNDSVSTDV